MFVLVFVRVCMFVCRCLCANAGLRAFVIASLCLFEFPRVCVRLFGCLCEIVWVRVCLCASCSVYVRVCAREYVYVSRIIVNQRSEEEHISPKRMVCA